MAQKRAAETPQVTVIDPLAKCPRKSFATGGSEDTATPASRQWAAPRKRQYEAAVAHEDAFSCHQKRQHCTALSVAELSECTSIASVFDIHARDRPQSLAVMEMWGTRRSLTWLELQELSVQVAANMQDRLTQVMSELDPDAIASLMHRSCAWLCVTLAILRCGRPFVWLSTGDEELERAGCTAASAKQAKLRERNVASLRLTRPCMIVVGSGVDAPSLTAAPDNGQPQPLRVDEAEIFRASPKAAALRQPKVDLQGVLGYMFTGGSTGSPKGVEVTHAMALHEVMRYPSVAPLSSRDKVLQHTSVFWAASAWGQIDIALAFGATLCISSSGTPSARKLCEAGITVLGVAPSTLTALLPGELPSVRCVFTWGEALQPAIAARWRSEGVRVVELLISTEYWLSFYSDEPPPTGQPTVFKVVDGVDIAVLPQGCSSQSAGAPTRSPNATGELCIGGPTVMTRYIDEPAAQSNIGEHGTTYYRAKDLVKIVAGAPHRAVVFLGRSDALIKVGAEFVNLTELEQRLSNIAADGGVSACVLPSRAPGRGSVAHCFATAASRDASPEDVAQLLQQLRLLLPRGCALHLLDSMPRDAVTGKVDRRALEGLIFSHSARSRPLSTSQQGQMLRRLLVRYPYCWLPLVCCCFCDWLWHPSVDAWAFGAMRWLTLPYVFLSTFYLLCDRWSSVAPFGRTSLLVILLLCSSNCSFFLLSSSGSQCVGWVPNFMALLYYGLSAVGVAHAFCGRLDWNIESASDAGRCVLAWSIAFWIMGPHYIFPEVAWWMEGSTWRRWYFALIWRETPFRQIWYASDYVLQRMCSATVADDERFEAVLDTNVSKSFDTNASKSPPTVVRVSEQAPKEEQRRSEQAFQKEVAQMEPTAQADTSSGSSTGRWRRWGSGTNDAGAVEEAQEQADQPSERDNGNARSEADLFYRGYPLFAWGLGDYEKTWWKECTVDIIDCKFNWGGMSGVGDAEGVGTVTAKASTESPAADITTSVELRALQLMDNYLQLGTASASTPLAGVNSLSFMALCRAVRSQLRRDLEPDVAMGCQTVGELLAKIQDLPQAVELPEREAPKKRGRTVHFTPSMWRGQCSWMYEASELLDWDAFQVAVRRLVARHEGLRSTMLDPPELLSPFQHTAGLHVNLWPYVTANLLGDQPRLARLVSALQRLVSFGLKYTWPRVGPSLDAAEHIDMDFVQCRSWNQVLWGVTEQRNSFKQPFSIRLFHMVPRAGVSGGVPKSYVHLICTHAFSDGFSGFPLVNDLADLYEAAAAGDDQERRLGPLPSALDVLQRRFHDALDCQPYETSPEQCSMRCTELYLPPACPPPQQYNHAVCFEYGACVVLRECAKSYSIPLDVLMLGVLTVALLRAGVADASGRLTQEGRGGQQQLAMALYTPMRDTPGSDAMVGLFSDWRELNVAFHPRSGITALGLILQLTGAIRARQWDMYDALQHMEHVLVNVLALDDQPRGAHGFKEVRVHEYHRKNHNFKLQRCWSDALRPLRLTFMQCEADMWWLALDCSDDRFPPSWCRRLVCEIERTVWHLQYQPLVPVEE